jgi:predicted PurR-regulated permease PerM
VADGFKSVRGWIVFAGYVLSVGVLYWARAVLVPVSLAVLITFVLTPPVTWLQRRIGRVGAVLTVVILVFTSTAWSVSPISRPALRRELVFW